MLIIERKIDQGIHIGGGIYIKVLKGSTKSRIRLGIEAPREVSVMREELEAAFADQTPGDNFPVIPGPWPNRTKDAA